MRAELPKLSMGHETFIHSFIQLDASAKDINPCQPGQSAQVDMVRDILQFFKFSEYPQTTLHPVYNSVVNSLPNDKIPEWSKLKPLADDEKYKCGREKEICFGRDRKHCGKRIKCWLPAFYPFPTMF